MPAQGRGANLVPQKRLSTPLPPNPVVPSATRQIAASLHSALSSQPFQPAQQQAQKRVEQTRIPQAKIPTPDIPRIANPTPEQTRAALTLAANHAKAIGPQAYKELPNDPANHEYINTVRHYATAAKQQALHAASTIASRAAAQLKPSPLTPLQRAIVGAETAEGNEAERSRNLSLARHEENAPKLRETLNLPGATINVTPIISAIANAHVAPKSFGVVGRLANEAIDLPGQSFLSGAITGSAARSAVEGKPQALENLGESILGQVEHPIRSAKESPLSTALLFAGGEGAAGDVLGKIARTGALGEKVADVASTVRPDLKLYGDESIPLRTYNPDPLRKAGQRIYEKALPKLPGNLKQADPFQAEGWRLRRNVVGTTLKPGTVDYMRGAGERTRRTIVKGDLERIDAAKPKAGEHAVPLIVQRVVRSPETLRADLEQEVGKLQQAQPKLKGSARAANRANLTNAKALLANKRFLADPHEAFDAAERVIQIQKPHTAAKLAAGTLDEDQLRAGLFPYAQAHMGARYFSVADHQAAEAAAATPAEKLAVSGRDQSGVAHPGLRHADGTYLPNKEILRHMAANGVEPPGFVSHRMGVAGRSSYYKSTLRQPTLERFNRTGASFAKGTADNSWEGLRGTLARQASERAQAEVRARELNRVAVGPSYETPAQAHAAADNFHATREGDPIEKLGRLQVVHLGSGKIVEKGAVAPTAATKDVLRQFGLEEHTGVPVAEQGRYALVPEQVVKRMQAHDDALKTNSDLGRAMQLYQQAFRRAKLNTSTRHIAGVIQEQGIRLGSEDLFPGVGRAARVGRKLEANLKQLAEVDKHGQLVDSNGPLGASYRELEGAIGRHGGVASASRQNDVVRQGDQFAQSSALGYILHGSEAAAKTRVGDAIAKPWRAYRATIEGGLSKVEHATYNPMFGKALKQSGFINSYRQVLKAQDDAVKDLIRGSLTPQKADALARRVDNMMGNWTHQTPAVRTLIGKFAPFGLWWLNSMRWLYRLPVTHPVKAGILGALYQATSEARNSKGQGYGAQSPVPAFLSGSIDAKLPVVGNVQVQPSYYSPGGTLGPEAPETFAEQFVPQLSGVYSALRGQNALSGEKLTDRQGKALGPLSILGNVAAEATAGPVPFATQAQSLMQGGGKPYGTANWLTDLAHALGLGPSQVKPGTTRPLTQQLVKLLSPVRFAYAGDGSGSATTSSDPYVQHQIKEAEAQASNGDPYLNYQIEQAEHKAATGLTPLQQHQIEQAEAQQSPAEQARINRAVQRYETAGGSPAQEARIKRAEERYDTVR